MKFQKKTIAALFLVFFYCGSSQALVSFGNLDCGEWFKRPTVRSWLLGYLSGLNFMMAYDKARYDPLDKVNSAEQVYLWMDNYYKNNPLKRVADEAVNLYLELQKK